MPKIILDPSNKGLYQETGNGTQVKQGGEAVNDITAITTATTLTHGGVFTISGSAAVTVILPAAADVAGSKFIFRTLSPANQHVITGSATDAGPYKYFSDEVEDANGQTLTFPAGAEGDSQSVAMICDGKNFMLFAQSGSMALS